MKRATSEGLISLLTSRESTARSQIDCTNLPDDSSFAELQRKYDADEPLMKSEVDTLLAFRLMNDEQQTFDEEGDVELQGASLLERDEQ